ncbi:hypothetical protein [Phenylobacterium sp.]|uniref:hypothetical protein n=1 Tax=Phenylobacterium sp. TaxID=1871053 RepID=UPI00286D8C47|nr:hypothetical protein [Phenylobacterium sp.]
MAGLPHTEPQPSPDEVITFALAVLLSITKPAKRDQLLARLEQAAEAAMAEAARNYNVIPIRGKWPDRLSPARKAQLLAAKAVSRLTERAILRRELL